MACPVPISLAFALHPYDVTALLAEQAQSSSGGMKVDASEGGNSSSKQASQPASNPAALALSTSFYKDGDGDGEQDDEPTHRYEQAERMVSGYHASDRC